MAYVSLRPSRWPLLAAALLVVLVGACRSTVTPSGPAAVSTPPAAATAEVPVGPPAPTRPAATAAPATKPAEQPPTYGPVVWTLTILHTGEVYGDVLPCG